MNIDYFKQNRTKICGIISILLLFLAVICVFLPLGDDFELFSIGLFFIVSSFIFALFGIIKGTKKSLGYVLCVPPIVIACVFVTVFILAVLPHNQKEKDVSKNNSHSFTNVLASDYLFQYERNVTSNSMYAKNNFCTALFAVCQAFNFFDDSHGRVDKAFLLSLLCGFDHSSKTEDGDAFYTVKEYFQGTDYNVYEFYTLYTNEQYEIVSIRNQKSEDKYFIRNKQHGFVKYVQDVVGGYENVLTTEKLTAFEKEIVYTYYLFTLWDLKLNRAQGEYYALKYDELEALGYDINHFTSEADFWIKQNSSRTDVNNQLYKMMKKTFNEYSNYSDFAVALFCEALYKKYVLNYL